MPVFASTIIAYTRQESFAGLKKDYRALPQENIARSVRSVTQQQ
jgi:hypothetical protein